MFALLNSATNFHGIAIFSPGTSVTGLVVGNAPINTNASMSWTNANAPAAAAFFPATATGAQGYAAAFTLPAAATAAAGAKISVTFKNAAGASVATTGTIVDAAQFGSDSKLYYALANCAEAKTIDTAAAGLAIFHVNSTTNTVLGYAHVTSSGNAYRSSHIHTGARNANGGPIVTLAAPSTAVLASYVSMTSGNLINATKTSDGAEYNAYYNYHTDPLYPGGELRGQLLISDPTTGYTGALETLTPECAKTASSLAQTRLAVNLETDLANCNSKAESIRTFAAGKSGVTVTIPNTPACKGASATKRNRQLKAATSSLELLFTSSGTASSIQGAQKFATDALSTGTVAGVNLATIVALVVPGGRTFTVTTTDGKSITFANGTVAAQPGVGAGTTATGLTVRVNAATAAAARTSALGYAKQAVCKSFAEQIANTTTNATSICEAKIEADTGKTGSTLFAGTASRRSMLQTSNFGVPFTAAGVSGASADSILQAVIAYATSSEGLTAARAAGITSFTYGGQTVTVQSVGPSFPAGTPSSTTGTGGSSYMPVPAINAAAGLAASPVVLLAALVAALFLLRTHIGLPISPTPGGLATANDHRPTTTNATTNATATCLSKLDSGSTLVAGTATVRRSLLQTATYKVPFTATGVSGAPADSILQAVIAYASSSEGLAAARAAGITSFTYGSQTVTVQSVGGGGGNINIPGAAAGLAASPVALLAALVAALFLLF
eukprot:tig00020553_g10535.t1